MSLRRYWVQYQLLYHSQTERNAAYIPSDMHAHMHSKLTRHGSLALDGLNVNHLWPAGTTPKFQMELAN